ncbi:MAG: restriction system protein [Verrucomicrobiota bacterium]
MARRSLLGNVIVGMAREAARAQRRAVAENRRQARDQLRFARLSEQNARLAAKEAKQQYLASRLEEADDLNFRLDGQVQELRSILSDWVAVTAESLFRSLRAVPPYPPFSPPTHLLTPGLRPVKEAYVRKVLPLTFFAKLFPKRREQHRQALLLAKEQFLEAERSYENAERNREDSLVQAHDQAAADYEAKVQERDQQITELWGAYWRHETDAVVAYAEMVLSGSTYPEDFPHEYRFAFVPESKLLVIEYELPPPGIVPTIQEYRYNRARDAIVEKANKPADCKQLYQDAVAAVGLRTMRELFSSDDAAAIQVLAFNGYIRSVDPATGKDIQPHLISVRTTRERFDELDLERVDKLVCLRNLGAQVSPRPYEIQGVKPIIDFDMVDKRFVEQADVLSALESRPNLMDLTPTEFEQLVANLFDRIGIEAKLTRSHRDGGVDVIGFDKRPVLGGKVVIQAKRYRHTVGVSAVRDLYGTMQHEGANKGILVTTAGYGPDAFTFASDKPIELIDGSGLLYLLDQQGIAARIVFPDDLAQSAGNF